MDRRASGIVVAWESVLRATPARRGGKWEASRRSIRKFVVSILGPLDPRAPRAETDAVGCPQAVAMLLNQLANGPGRVDEHDGRGPKYASSRLSSIRLLGRGVFRPLSTARS
jgi:hypothetical protein